MGLVMLGMALLPLPGGLDPNDPAALAAAMPSMGPAHFIFPFLAHALGTLAGAWLAARLALGSRLRAGLIVGAFFLLGGIINAALLPAMLWFEAADLLLAYLPMGWLGSRLAGAAA
jgi:hypothetical protein